MAKADWSVIRVELVGGPSEDLDPPPGRDFLVSSGHSLMQFGVAIDYAFARWDLGHLHAFRMSDGLEYMLGGDEDRSIPSTDSTRIGLLGLAQGATFEYVFDLGDEWVHRCEVLTVDVDPQEEFGDEPIAPVPLFGWGTIPDQYGRTTPDD
ncbi:MAG: plasmid pRiA4b ORF-3 family protein [Actinobacteria bacterium]|nr:plasmid pRiA4b ORF-3 family protein [Actinomycetota bacterium]